MSTSRVAVPADRRAFIGRIATFLAGTMLLGRPRPSRADVQEDNPFLCELMIFAGNFAPRGWGLCNGQLLSISQNQALFSLLGTMYGGNGVTNFALPDLRDRVPIHQGQGPGLSPRALGERGGAASHTLSITELPIHSHGVRASSGVGSAVSPTGMYPARNPAAIPQYGVTADVAMATLAIGNTGGGQPHPNLQPYLGLNFVIALQGIYPSS